MNPANAVATRALGIDIVVIAKAFAAHSTRFPEDTLPAYTIAYLTPPDPA